MKLVQATKVREVPIGECVSVEADGHGLALCNVKGTIYALDNTCPHAGGPLGEGCLLGDIIECPWHGWRFNVRTGERPENPQITVDRFPVRIIDDIVHIELPDR